MTSTSREHVDEAVGAWGLSSVMYADIGLHTIRPLLTDADAVHLLQLNHTSARFYLRHPYRIKQLIRSTNLSTRRTWMSWILSRLSASTSDISNVRKAMAKFSGPIQIKRLSVTECCDGDVDVICNALRRNVVLRELSVATNNIGNASVQRLAYSLENNTCLRQIDLSFNGVEDSGAKALCTVLQNSQTVLEELKLYHNGITDIGAKAIAESLRANSTLQLLDLAFNIITSNGARAIALVLKDNRSLKMLDLSGNEIDDNGAVMISETLQQTQSLQQLGLDLSLFGSEGIRSFATALTHNTSLLQVDLFFRQVLVSEQIDAVIEAIRVNTTLRTLNLSFYAVDRDLALLLYRPLRYHASIKNIAFHYHQMSNEAANILSNLKASGSSLRHITFSDSWMVSAKYL